MRRHPRAPAREDGADAMSETFLLVPLVALYLLSIVLLIAQIRPPGVDAAPRSARMREPPSEAMHLSIADTERPYLTSVRFLAAFGVDVRRVRDIRVYAHGGALESFPARLIALLFDLYTRGGLRGADAMALLFHGRPLGDGEAVYFALVDTSPEPSVVAFVDRRPGCA